MKTKSIREILDLISLLCHFSPTPQAVCHALGIQWEASETVVCIHLNDAVYFKPPASNPLWRRQWKAFLTDHADAVARIHAVAAPGSLDGQPGSAS